MGASHNASEAEARLQAQGAREGLSPPAAPVVAALAGLAAGWLAAGSAGLLAHSLRHALTWVAFGVALVAAWPDGERFWARLALLLGGLAVAVAMTASALQPANVMAAAVFLATLAGAQDGLGRRILAAAATAVAVLGVWRLALTSMPWLWLAADAAGGAMGRFAGRLTGEPLWVGATFAGIDFLAVMAALYVGWLIRVQPPRLPRALYGAVAILVGHLCYLIALTVSAKLLGLLPEPAAEQGWAWGGALRTLIPWNFPALACAIHLAIAACMFRWAPLPADAPAPSTRWGQRARLLLWIGSGVMAALLPALTTLPFGKADLEGKKIVVYRKGFLNWLKPVHGEYGRLAIGMYGMLPTYLESLGARCVVSPDLSEQDLRDASVLILLYPNKPWEAGQLERMWSFVRRGGSLLVFGEHTVREADSGSRFNDVLAPTAMRVRFDSAMFEVGGWLQSYEALAHPTTAGIADDRNQVGVVIGASVQARWPACPLLVGRWGWADPGDPGSGAAMMGNRHYDAGEKLGDILLAAEQPMGAGKVVAFGDTSSITNGITVGSHVFTSRLLGYLAGGLAGSQAPWRQGVGLVAALALAILFIVRSEESRTACGALLLATSLFICTAASYRMAEVLPDGRGKSPNNLAYIDTSHIEANSDESWRPDGTGGLAQTLMRNGYLTLHLPELTAARLKRAGLLVSIAPSKAFSRAERKAVREFVEDGGVFLCTVGYEACGPSRSLLADFGLCVGGRRSASGKPADAPQPLGHFKSPYVNPGGYMAHVRFHAAWPIECAGPDAQPIAYGPKDTTVIISRKVGRGKAVAVGDTCFAMDKNLEREGGEPFEGMRENADFWRWFLTYLRDQPRWIPPKPQPKAPPKPPDSEEEQ